MCCILCWCCCCNCWCPSGGSFRPSWRYILVSGWVDLKSQSTAGPQRVFMLTYANVSAVQGCLCMQSPPFIFILLTYLLTAWLQQHRSGPAARTVPNTQWTLQLHPTNFPACLLACDNHKIPNLRKLWAYMLTYHSRSISKPTPPTSQPSTF